MSWINWLCIFLVIAGIGLFLVGANIYNPIVGWAGFYMVIGGILVYLVVYLYTELKKKQPAKEAAQNP
jgi:multisubunit Na+/H+ antiporter MnhB subunit